MFEIRCFCEDNKLPKVMWALDGLVVGMPQTIPVRNAVADKGKVKAIVQDTVISQVISKINELAPKTELTNKTLATMVRESGGKAVSTPSMVHRFTRELGLLKRTGKGVYITTGVSNQ